MSLYKPKGSPYYHYDFVVKGRRYHGSTHAESKRVAQLVETRERHAAIVGDNRKPPITVDEVCGVYAEHAETLPSWPTIKYMLANLVNGLGKSTLLSEVGQLRLQQYFAKRRGAGLSNASINREIDNARAVWRRVRKTHDIGEMPEWGDLYLKVAEVAPRELTIDEEPDLFAEMRADIVDVCDFALKSGWRRSEVIGLRWADVDLHAAQAITRIKGGNIVRRPLTPTLIALIANQPKVGPFVFTYVCQKTKSAYIDKQGRKQPARKAGDRYPMTATALRKPWTAAKKAGGVEAFRFHDLRHTRGTRIVRETGSLAAAKAALQHCHIKTTLRYAHVLDDDVRNALEASESRNSPESVAPPQRKRDVTDAWEALVSPCKRDALPTELTAHF